MVVCFECDWGYLRCGLVVDGLVFLMKHLGLFVDGDCVELGVVIVLDDWV